MSQVIVLLWYGTNALNPTYESHLHAWAAARQAQLQAPIESTSASYDPALVTETERLIEDARIALGALDPDSALAKLTEAEQLLLKRPDLPQSAWLLAEVLKLRADALSDDPAHESEVQELRRQVLGLGGQREAAYATEAGLGGRPPSRARRVIGLLPRDELEVDGRPASGRIDVSAGLHQMRVLRRDRAVWAGWVTVHPKATRVYVSPPPVEPCSLDDLSATDVTATSVRPEPGTHCQRWAVARPAPGGGVRGGGIEVASCRRESCGPFLTWRYSAPKVSFSSHPHASRWPAWASYLALGVIAATATGVVLWQAGAFESPPPGQTYWVYEGIDAPTGFRF